LPFCWKLTSDGRVKDYLCCGIKLGKMGKIKYVVKRIIYFIIGKAIRGNTDY